MKDEEQTARESLPTKDPLSQAAKTSLPKEWRTPKNLQMENIIGNIEREVSTRSRLRNLCNNCAFVSQVEPKTVNDAINDEHWFLAMHEELDQFKRNEV